MVVPEPGNRQKMVFVCRHAIERRLEAEGVSPDDICLFMSDGQFVVRAAQIIRKELAVSVPLNVEQRRVFIHPGRERHQHERSRKSISRRWTNGGDYFVYRDAFVYVCDSGSIITTISIDERQYQTLLGLGFVPNIESTSNHLVGGRSS